MRKQRLRPFAATLVAAVLWYSTAAAGPEFSVALKGYDAVAYQAQGQTTPGENQHAVFWNGATWLFASDANRKQFEADPDRYAPRYDGHCAYAAAKQYKAPGSPHHWRVVDGRLYVNFNDEAQRLWVEDSPGHIAAGNVNWPRLNAD
jgi:YHS domain-containing protein